MVVVVLFGLKQEYHHGDIDFKRVDKIYICSC